MLKLHSITAGVCRILNSTYVSKHALAYTDSVQIKVDLQACFFLIFPFSVDGEESGRGGNVCVVYSSI